MIDYIEIKKQLEGRINSLQDELNFILHSLDSAMERRDSRLIRLLTEQGIKVSKEAQRLEFGLRSF